VNYLNVKNLRFRNLILVDILATFIAALGVALYKGYSTALIPLFLGFLSGIIITMLFGPNRGYKHLQQAQLERFSKFRERVATEGVVDETADIARARRIAWWRSEQKYGAIVSSEVKDFAEVFRRSGKIYVIYRQTLNSLLAKLPIEDEDLNKLTPSEHRVFDALRITGNITLGEKQQWHFVTNLLAT
jgi:hypothetical protein